MSYAGGQSSSNHGVHAMKPYILICTVGTSLKRHLERWYCTAHGATKKIDDFDAADWDDAVQHFQSLDPLDQQCGAEINSIQAMIAEGCVAENPQIYLFHSETAQGRDIAAFLQRCLRSADHHRLMPQLHEIAGLRDNSPQTFRTQGLRTLVRKLCGTIKEHSPAACAINATGGYKAQIAIAVMIGQALNVPVYYKHEFFAEKSVIRFPPLPITLDEQVWLRNRSLFHDLHQEDDFVLADRFASEWEEVLESLIERERQEGQEFLMLSPAGELMHEKFKDRPRTADSPRLKDAPRKEPATMGKDHFSKGQKEIQAFMQNVVDQNRFVVSCYCFYVNSGLPSQNEFRITPKGVTGVYSDGSFTARFGVTTTAESDVQEDMAVAQLNRWLARHA